MPPASSLTTVAIIGVGDIGERLAVALAASGRVGRLVLAGRAGGKPAAIAATVATAYDCIVEPVEVDALRLDEIARLLDRTGPDLVIQCASLRSPWSLAGRDDEVARGILAAGLAVRIPYQLPVVRSVMQAAKAAGYAGPIANVSFPDVTGPILRTLGLAPTLGLGNVSMLSLRVRAALRAADPAADLPLIRVVAHHAQLVPSMRGRDPGEEARSRVYLGEQGERRDDLAYAAPGSDPGPRYNVVTVASALPVLEALLPDAPPLRVSVPAPHGMPGGYPVRIELGRVSLDLPAGVAVDEAIAFNERMAAGDGVDRIDPDGTVHFSEQAHRAVASFAPDLAEPLALDQIEARAARLDALLA
jgi:hypothetical protein